MRIRKNANVVSNNGHESLLQKNLCQLNQSPWDIQQFDEYVVYCNVNHAGNGNLSGSFGAYERKITFGDGLASMKTFGGENDKLISVEGENDKLSVDPKNDYTKMNEVGEELILLCDVSDENGWQCGRVVKNGETMCDHHVIGQLQNHAVWTTKKKPEPGPVHESKAGTRSRRTKKRASTSPYEFYYYSGFGPTWGKKRGTMGSSFSNMCNEPAKVAFDDNKVKETSVDNDDMGICDDGDDNKKGKTGKKRGRKPMKARSLKSLM